MTMFKQLGQRSFRVLATFGFLLFVLGRSEVIDVRYEYQAEPSSSVYVLGDHPLFGNNDVTRAVRLAPLETNVWGASFDVPKNTGIDLSFLVRQDSPALLADSANGRLLDYHMVVATDSEPEEEKSPAHPEISTPRVEMFTFVPRHFQGRKVRVLLPRNYTENMGERYPVLYALDGQNVFAPGGPFGSWDMDVTVKRMMASGEIPEVIVVALDNSSDRMSEYLPEYGAYNDEYPSLKNIKGRGGEFLSMMRDELMPIINGHYRTQTGPEHTSIIGSSLGGLIAYQAANEFTDTFGAAACLSPAFHAALEESVKLADRPMSQHARIYLDSGNVGSSNDGFKNTMEVRDHLIRSGHPLGPDFMHTVGLGHGHNEAAWRERTPFVLQWMYGKL